MPVTRRQILENGLTTLAAVAAGGALAALPRTAAARSAQASPAKPAPAAPSAKLKLLILGGTAFTGPHLVRLALSRGHEVAIFNRGRTERRIGGIPDQTERLVGDRDPKVGDGLKALEGDRRWDAVIDLSGQYPRHVRASAELLRNRVRHYSFVSTISVFRQPYPAVLDENAPVETLDDPTTEDMAGGRNYGGLKAACERAAVEGMASPDKVAVVRPGLIIGPGDNTDRFTYWPVRAAGLGAGPGETWSPSMLCPGSPTDPVQGIDARDLAAWLLLLAERSTVGTFNTVGPAQPTGFGELIDACVKAAGPAAAKPVWADWSTLQAHQVAPWAEMPAWVPQPESPDEGHVAKVVNAKAIAAGLTFRPLAETVRDTLAWWPSEVERRERVGKDVVEQARSEGKQPPTLPPHQKLRAGISPEKEQRVLAAIAAAK